jgi:hypothetical protein
MGTSHLVSAAARPTVGGYPILSCHLGNWGSNASVELGFIKKLFKRDKGK